MFLYYDDHGIILLFVNLGNLNTLCLCFLELKDTFLRLFFIIGICSNILIVQVYCIIYYWFIVLIVFVILIYSMFFN